MAGKKKVMTHEETLSMDAEVVESSLLPAEPLKKNHNKNHAMSKGRYALPDLPTLLAEIMGEKKNGITAAKLILAALRKRAVAGDVRAAELLLDRSYGKTPDNINLNKTEKQIILIAGGQKLEF